MSGAIISSPHKHSGSSVSTIMLEVALALVPGMIIYLWQIGWGVLFQVLAAILFALLFEAGMLRLRKLPMKIFLCDGSAVVTASLLALTLSPYTPWWVTLAAVAFAIILVKHAYGGLGHNIFNPAMAGYVFVLLSFPVETTQWPAARDLVDVAPGFVTELKIFLSGFDSVLQVDGTSAATPLSYTKSELSGMAMLSEIKHESIYGILGGTGWELVNIGFLFGGIWLLFRGIINWHIPVALILTMVIISSMFYWYDPDVYANPVFHVFSGATILGAFFIATDPVSAATTTKGRLIYGAGIGLFTYIIRVFAAFPDGLAFAVLLMNACVPVLDHYTKPKVLGESANA